MTTEQTILAGLILETYKQTIGPYISKVSNSLARILKVEVDTASAIFSDRFNNYMQRACNDNTYIPVIVSKHKPIKLKDVYEPLTLQKNDESGSNKIEYKIDNIDKSFLEQNNRLLIVDTAGMGKSTILKWILFSVIENHLAIPFIVELRKISDDHTVVMELQSKLSDLGEEFSVDVIINLLKSGKLVIMFDGYDEVSQDNKGSVTKQIGEIISKAPDNYYIITSRDEASLNSLTKFTLFTIRPLIEDEAYNLIRRYGENSLTAEMCIQKIREINDPSINEFLTNPLLVTLLFSAFDYKKVIPIKKHIFYEQVFDAFFDRHDLSKEEGTFIHERRCKLDQGDFSSILKFLGLASLNLQTVDFTRTQLQIALEDFKKFNSFVQFSIPAFIDDITSSVPLFKKDGETYRWSHKSLQEYFAASFIAFDLDHRKELIFNRYFGGEDLVLSNFNLLDLFASIDTKYFNNKFVIPFLRRYVEECEKSAHAYFILLKCSIHDSQYLSELLYSRYVSLTCIRQDPKNKRYKSDIFHQLRRKTSDYFKKRYGLGSKVGRHGVIGPRLIKFNLDEICDVRFYLCQLPSSATIELIIRHIPSLRGKIRYSSALLMTHLRTMNDSSVRRFITAIEENYSIEFTDPSQVAMLLSNGIPDFRMICALIQEPITYIRPYDHIQVDLAKSYIAQRGNESDELPFLRL